MSERKEIETFEEIEVSLSKTERFIEDNQKSLVIAVVAILAVAGIFWFYMRNVENQNKAALSQMFVAEQYFEKDSFQLAINGDGNYPGFKKIADQYSSTKAANLANYYIGISYLNLGQEDKAIEYLDKFDAGDILISTIAVGAIGDAYMEKGSMNKAYDYYLQAAQKDNNDFTSPLYLLKAGVAQEELGNYKKAVELYERIKEKYSESNEGRKIDKYISRAKIKISNS